GNRDDGDGSPPSSFPHPLTEQTMRLAEHLIAVPRRKLRTDRRLARLRPHEGRTPDPHEAGPPFPPAPEVPRHQHLVIVADRDCSEVEGLGPSGTWTTFTRPVPAAGRSGRHRRAASPRYRPLRTAAQRSTRATPAAPSGRRRTLRPPYPRLARTATSRRGRGTSPMHGSAPLQRG